MEPLTGNSKSPTTSLAENCASEGHPSSRVCCATHNNSPDLQAAGHMESMGLEEVAAVSMDLREVGHLEPMCYADPTDWRRWAHVVIWSPRLPSQWSYRRNKWPRRRRCRQGLIETKPFSCTWPGVLLAHITL